MTARAVLPLAELEPLAGAWLPVLLTLLHARIASEQTLAAQLRPKALVLTRQSARAQNMHTTYLANKEKTCIDCHKGIAHHLPHIPPGQGPSDSPGQVVPKEGGEALAPAAESGGEKKGG